MEEKELLEIIEEAARDGRKELHLSNERIVSIPTEIRNLTNLTELDLSGNQLTSVPKELGQLTNLKVLSLHHNQLTSVPSELANLTNLEKLDLDHNRLTSVPAELGQLKNLEELWLLGNNLKSIPKGLGQLKNLRVLVLYANKLTSVPEELGQLKNLNELDLCLNRLINVPEELGQLKNLKGLYLRNNGLTSVPMALGQLKNLNVLDLKRNPMRSPPPEVVEQGTQAILAYLRELEKGKKGRYEAKLLILGDGGEGKTCVSRALRRRIFKEQIRTEGVEVVQWKFENPKFPNEKDKEITLNIWDFEGQEINHQSHQFFLIDKSLYLLVINGRKSFKLERTEYWLDTIKARAPESRVILVASECENTTPSWPLDKLKQEYGDLLQGESWYFPVGCENGKGINDLADEIKRAAADMEQMGKGWPETYQKAEKAIEEIRDKKVSVGRNKLYEIFGKSGIDKDGFENAAGQMETLGLITQFKDSPELEDFVVLNPQWLTKGISLVMEDKQLHKDKGEITHKRMKEIWDKGYSGLYPTLGSCMKEFELLYDMEDIPGCLVPLRFGDVRPEIPWSEITGAKERRIEYKLNIHPPKGIMSRFIVKTHYMIAKTDAMPKGVYWNNGVFLRTGEGEYRSEALCEFDEGEKTLRLTVRAAFPQNMIEQLNGFAKSLFSFFDGLQPERKYGCVKFEEEEELECEGTHSERRIFSALVKDRILDCEYGWHDVEPKKLVYGFSSFGKLIVSAEKMKEMVKEGVKQIQSDVMSLLVSVDKIGTRVDEIREQGKRLPAEIGQQVELNLREYLRLLDEMLDNRDFNSAPAVISIEGVDGSKFNPKNWFEKKYVLRPFCEREGRVHPGDFVVPFNKPREWWVKTAPRLSMAVKVLSAGVQIACAGLPLGVKPEVFEAVEKHAEFMKELAGHLELEGGAESDVSEEAGRTVEKMKGKDRLRDLRQLSGDDEKRIARMQLAELFSEIAPKNYKGRQWGPLRRVRMPDNTYRWLCKEHAEEYRK
ncbi:MAG: leucine-rich repeat domain-containing protein [Planctomycetes bacterium]|nr:leucine-rich repeat domain-containing protein [Planctomycetota bacterium]MBL7145448.1 leucine-rich repeat domain-containing protein [Phycisphaerae bacterium]